MRDRMYQEELFAQRTPYLQWLKGQQEMERTMDRPEAGKQVCALPFSSCMDSVSGYGVFRADTIYLFVKTGGSLVKGAETMIAEIFSQRPGSMLVYADEDYRGSLSAFYEMDGKAGEGGLYRGAPWFKPEFSPDTLSSFFYLGSIFAVRGDVILRMIDVHGDSIGIYELVYWIFMEVLAVWQSLADTGIVHLAKVLYTNDSPASAARLECSAHIKSLYESKEPVQELVSIIIPSKDNAKILQRCLETLMQNTIYDKGAVHCEIIIVDNGSSPTQRQHIAEFMEKATHRQPDFTFLYLYEESPFNFSAMCNRGAQAAAGRYLLFLNDDIEVLDTEEGGRWLARMMAYARRRHVGAVGAKLYYPLVPADSGCYRIQHTGITNMGIGPAHKLGGMTDTGSLYHGHNTMNYDMLAVTAACMMVRKSVFDEMGGFDESLAVAYNDVALCFRLYQSGYFNVQVNEAVLIHHESLSRGLDTSPQKRKRLAEEKERLYQQYPEFRAWDPFYSPHLVQWKRDVDYNTNFLYACDEIVVPESVHVSEQSRIFRQRGKSGILGKIRDRLTGYDLLMAQIDSIEQEEQTVTVNGWCVQRNRNNAGISRRLCLCNGKQVYMFEILPKLREDVASVFAADGSTANVALSGIQVRFERNGLQRGRYRIAILFHERQLLWAMNGKGEQIEVEI